KKCHIPHIYIFFSSRLKSWTKHHNSFTGHTIWCIALLLLCASTGFAQSKFRISGYVTDSLNAPIPKATVVLNPGKNSTQADERGYFVFQNLYEGAYTLEASCLGYRPTTQNVDLEQHHESVNIRLAPNSRNIDEVDVQGKIGAVDNLIQAE